MNSAIRALCAIHADCGREDQPLPPLRAVEPTWYPPTPPVPGTEPLRDGCGYRDNPRRAPPIEAPRTSKPWWKIWRTR